MAMQGQEQEVMTHEGGMGDDGMSFFDIVVGGGDDKSIQAAKCRGQC